MPMILLRNKRHPELMLEYTDKKYKNALAIKAGGPIRVGDRVTLSKKDAFRLYTVAWGVREYLKLCK